VTHEPNSRKGSGAKQEGPGQSAVYGNYLPVPRIKGVWSKKPAKRRYGKEKKIDRKK